MKLNKTRHCLNCGTYIGSTNFCHHCGQMNTDKRLTLRQVLKDFFGDYFTFDSKFFRSLLPLLTKPGHLTREYVAGRRVSYVLPLRLYIFTTFLFFFVLTLSTQFDKKNLENMMSDNFVQAADSLRTILDEHEPHISMRTQESLFERLDSTFVLDYKTEENDSKIVFSTGEAEEEDSRFERYLRNKALYLQRLGSRGKTVFFKAAINQIPKVLFFMLPIFALILKLLYIRHKIFFVEHFIFALHMHTKTFILMLLLILLPKWYCFLAIWITILIYLFLSMRSFFGQGFWKTLLKMNLLLWLYSFVLIPAAILLLMLAMVSI